MKFPVRDEKGNQIDAVIEIDGNSIILQSRGGTKGTERAKNTEYSIALRLLLVRFQQHKDLFVYGLVDSSRVQGIPETSRQILQQTELSKSPEELFTLISSRMQAVGKPPSTERYVGNANKRVRFIFSKVRPIDLVQIANGGEVVDVQSQESAISSPELEWVEGDLKLIAHFRRERAYGLSDAKKSAFIQQHGKLFCEICQFDPIAVYKEPIASACIEVHHRELAVSKMAIGHKTKLADLQCLCANCHRFVHASLKRASTSSV